MNSSLLLLFFVCLQVCPWKLHPPEAGYDGACRGRPDVLLIAREPGLKVSLVVASFIWVLEKTLARRIWEWKSARLPRLYVLEWKGEKGEVAEIKSLKSSTQRTLQYHPLPAPPVCWKTSRISLASQLRICQGATAKPSFKISEYSALFTFPGSPVQLSVAIKTTALLSPVTFLVFRSLSLRKGFQSKCCALGPKLKTDLVWSVRLCW